MPELGFFNRSFGDKYEKYDIPKNGRDAFFDVYA